MYVTKSLERYLQLMNARHTLTSSDTYFKTIFGMY